MKKLLIAACFMLGFAGLASAQAVKKSVPAKVVKMEKAKPAAAPVADASGPKKADGTLDKRFKANKSAKTEATGPMKADGTPDKRYKANKGKKKAE